MTRNGKVSAAIALCCTVVGAALTGCEEASEAGSPPAASGTPAPKAEAPISGTEKIEVDGLSVNVSCSGSPSEDRPVIMLLHGGGDQLKDLADLQQTLSEQNLVCSYDRLGAGESDKPAGPQSLEDSGKVLTAVLDQVAGDAPVVLAGHSLGGLIAGRYTPEHQDRVKGLVLLDATSPTQGGDLESVVPESEAGPVADLVAKTVATLEGQNPEMLATPDGDVASAGDIPVEVIQHGKQYLAAAVPDYGPAMERAWTEGQIKWLGVSTRSVLSIAENSEHHIYRDEPDVAVEAIQRVAEQAADIG